MKKENENKLEVHLPDSGDQSMNWVDGKPEIRWNPETKFPKINFLSNHQASMDRVYYGGTENLYEAIKVIEAWGLGFCLGNVIKYISRSGKKDPAKNIEDLEKAKWYLEREINKLKTDGIEAE